jgi:hypothetical protein
MSGKGLGVEVAEAIGPSGSKCVGLYLEGWSSGGAVPGGHLPHQVELLGATLSPEGQSFKLR